MKLRDLHSNTPIQSPICIPSPSHGVVVEEGDRVKAVSDQQHLGTAMIGHLHMKPNRAAEQDRTPEPLVAPLQAETEPDEVGHILRAWKETFGMDLDRGRVTMHLGGLRKWHTRWSR